MAGHQAQGTLLATIWLVLCACSVGGSKGQPPSGSPDASSISGEEQVAAAGSPRALVARSSEAAMPDALARATAAIDSETLDRLAGLMLVPWGTKNAPDPGSLRIESMAFSDGSGLVVIGFQDWSASVDPTVLFNDDYRISATADFEIGVRDDELTPAVIIFDGRIAVSVQAWNEEKISTSDAEALAIAYFHGLRSP